MAKAQDAPPSNVGMMGMGDISVIRNILFGQQAAEFESNFDLHTQRMDKTDGENNARFQKLESDLTLRINQLERDLNTRIQNLEAHLAQTASQINDKIDKTSKDDKEAIGRMLIEIGNRLVEG